jgi:hypothetical protein
MERLLEEFYQELRDSNWQFFLRKNERHQTFPSLSWRFITFFVKFLFDRLGFLSFFGKIELDKVNLVIEILLMITHLALVIQAQRGNQRVINRAMAFNLFRLVIQIPLILSKVR